jgi:hypothetical protein
MIRTLLALAFAAMLSATPAAAQDMWRHRESGISLPRAVGQMRLTQERDASGGGNYDVILQYGYERTPVTVYIYRSAYPNPALWYERTRLAMNEHVGSGHRDAAPRSFTLGGAPAPNGLREEIQLDPGHSTAIAMAQIGEWMVKVRITSASLDRTGIGEAMDRLLGAMQFARATPAPLPLVVPGPCEGDTRMAGRAITGTGSEEAVAAAAVFGLIGYGEARGIDGLAAHPDQWCRVTATRLPASLGSLYRRRLGNGWVALLGDSGIAAAAVPIDVPGRAQAALFASTTRSTQAVAVYDAMPDPDEAIILAIPVVTGERRGLVEVGAEPAGANESRGKR